MLEGPHIFLIDLTKGMKDFSSSNVCISLQYIIPFSVPIDYLNLKSCYLCEICESTSVPDSSIFVNHFSAQAASPTFAQALMTALYVTVLALTPFR